MKLEIKQVGFSAEKEQVFLNRLPDEVKRVNLEWELKTQLAEDFGWLEFTSKYKFDQTGKIFDLKSGQGLVELTARGEIIEEIEAMKKIEIGLSQKSELVWVHFSPKNEKLGYGQNCVDFWRLNGDEVVWNRMVVKNDFEEMKKIRALFDGDSEIKNEMELLKSPVSVDLKLAEIFNLFELSESRNFEDFDYINRVVDKYLDEFDKDFGDELVNKSDLIFRLYSACFKKIRFGEINLEDYMYGIMREVRVEKSFGCFATTTVGSFGEKIGYYVLPSGEVKKGAIPEGFKECKQCGCWYGGEKCPFC